MIVPADFVADLSEYPAEFFINGKPIPFDLGIQILKYINLEVDENDEV